MSEDEKFHYRVSEEFAALYRDFWTRFTEAHTRTAEYNKANPDHPLYVVRSYDHSVNVLGFEDTHPRRTPPVGLSRAIGRKWLISSRGAKGDPWREVIREHSNYPNAQRDVFGPLKVESHLLNLDLGRVFSAGVYDCGDLGMFIRIGGRYDDLNAHVTHVPPSIFHTAYEAAGYDKQVKVDA